MRIGVAAAALCLGLMSLALAAESGAAMVRHNLNIPRRSLDVALKDLAQQTGLQIVRYSDAVKGDALVGPLNGEYSVDEALRALLAPSGLTYRPLNDRAYIILTPAELSEKTGANAPPWTEDILVAQQAGATTRPADTQLAQAQSPPTQQSSAAAADQSAPAESATDDERLQLGEVVVTATRHAERLIDVPIAITALSSRDIEARGITQYVDILSSVPGVYYEDAGPGATTIRMRGITPGGGATPPTVATYFGDIPMSAQGGGNLGQHGTPRFVDIERMEVLRGPQGTVFGANALAGAIRVLPATPDLGALEYKLGTRGFATAHSDDLSYHLEGTLNLPLVEDRFALRLVGYQDEIAGYIDNRTPAQGPIDYSAAVANLTGGAVSLPPGTLLTPPTEAIDERDINSVETTGLRAAAAWQATERLRFDLMLSSQSAEMDSESSVNADTYEITRTLDFFAPGRTGEDLELAGFTALYEWDAVSLTAVTSYTRLEMSRLNDASDIVPPMVPWYFVESRESDAFTQEVRLASRGDGRFTWTVGAFYLDRETDGGQLIADYACATSPPCIPQLFSGGAQDFALDLDFHLFEEQMALFFDTSWEFAPRWSVGVGARYLEEDIGIRLESIGPLAPPPGPSNGGEDSADKFNPAASLRFKPNEDVMLYAQASDGFRSGVANQPLPPICQQQAADLGLSIQAVTEPDSVRNYEVGFKSVLAGGRMSLNLAAYRLEWMDIPATVILPCAFSNIFNAGDASGKGVELEMAGRLGESWRFNLAASYNKLTYDDDVLPAVGEPGEQVAGSPAKNYSVGLEYDFNLGDTWSGLARADWAYVGTVVPDRQLGPLPALPSYDTLNLRLGFAKGPLALELFGRNVSDERGVSSVEAIQFGGEQTLIRPREVGVELRYSYK